jgi:hypothetical protein
MYLSLLFGFFLNENSSGGSKKDFYSTLFLVYSFSIDFNTGIKELINSSVPHPFLHYLIIGIANKYLQNKINKMEEKYQNWFEQNFNFTIDHMRFIRYFMDSNNLNSEQMESLLRKVYK